MKSGTIFCLKRKSDRSITNCTQTISKWENSFFESIDKCFHTGTPAKDHPCSDDHSTTSNIAESTVRCQNCKKCKNHRVTPGAYGVDRKSGARQRNKRWGRVGLGEHSFLDSLLSRSSAYLQSLIALQRLDLSGLLFSKVIPYWEWRQGCLWIKRRRGTINIKYSFRSQKKMLKKTYVLFPILAFKFLVRVTMVVLSMR